MFALGGLFGGIRSGVEVPEGFLLGNGILIVCQYNIWIKGEVSEIFHGSHSVLRVAVV